MKLKQPLTLTILLLAIQLSAQNYVPVVFIVSDFATNKNLNGAQVSIRQAGWATKSTGVDGKVSFENVPVGAINFIITMDGFQLFEGEENVSSEVKNNTFRIPLTAIPTTKDKILVTGEVVDKEGRDIEGALVEVKAANIIQNGLTDKSGNYSIEISLNTGYTVTNLMIEAKKGDCKVKQNVDIPRGNVVYKDIKIDCQTNTLKETNKESKPILDCGEKYESKNGVFIELCECIKKSNKVICRLKVVNRNPNIETINKTACGDRSYLVYEGQEFKIKHLKIKDKLITYPCKHYDLVYNVPIEMEAEFFVGDTQMENITLLKFYSFSVDCKFTNIPLVSK